MAYRHVTVLAQEAVDHLAVKAGGTYVDCTVGGGGHSAAILASSPTARLIGIDRDPAALAAARQRLEAWEDRVNLVQGNFADIQQLLAECGVESVDGVLMDLGVSSPQLDEAERGFSYHQDARLDMRMDNTRGTTAEELVNEATQAELTRIIREYGEERWAGRIARQICQERLKKRIVTTTQLAEIAKSAIPAAARREGPHPARRTFQALRIAVNDELGSLQRGLAGALEVLKPGGRLAVITFHSLEDSIVKEFYRREARPCVCPPELPCVCGKLARLRIVTPKGVKPSPSEVAQNPRARSATLRVAERVLPQKENA